MIWLGITIFAALMALLAPERHRGSLLVILCIEIGVQAFKAPELAEARKSLFFWAWAFTSYSTYVLSKDQNSRQAVAITTLTLSSAMCYILGAALGQPDYLDRPRVLHHLFWADVVVVAAIAIGGFDGVAQLVRNIASGRLVRRNG